MRTPPPSCPPVVRLAPEDFKGRPAPGLRAIWFGHASVYLEIDGVRVMTDPVLSDYASPFAGIGPKRFHPPPLALEALPKIDAVVISHDHYDHLDVQTVKHLAQSGTHFFVPLGIGAHLERWGVPARAVHRAGLVAVGRHQRREADQHARPALLQPRPARRQRDAVVVVVDRRPGAQGVLQRRHRLRRRISARSASAWARSISAC